MLRCLFQWGSNVEEPHGAAMCGSRACRWATLALGPAAARSHVPQLNSKGHNVTPLLGCRGGPDERWPPHAAFLHIDLKHDAAA